jgi:hypothetical protein
MTQKISSFGKFLLKNVIFNELYLNIVLISLSILGTCAHVIYGYYERFETYNSIINNETTYSFTNSSLNFCVTLSTIGLLKTDLSYTIMLPLACVLILILLTQSRIGQSKWNLMNRYCSNLKRPGFLTIFGFQSKKNRFIVIFTYSIMAQNVWITVLKANFLPQNGDKYKYFTTLITFFEQIAIAFLIGLRFYPILAYLNLLNMKIFKMKVEHKNSIKAFDIICGWLITIYMVLNLGYTMFFHLTCLTYFEENDFTVIALLGKFKSIL